MGADQQSLHVVAKADISKIYPFSRFDQCVRMGCGACVTANNKVLLGSAFPTLPRIENPPGPDLAVLLNADGEPSPQKAPEEPAPEQ
jgi:hypothetical protein